MKEETLLDIAASNYRAALKQYKYATGDERELNYVGYLLQQSTELCIKHCFEMSGEKYPHTHAIEDLLDEADQLKIIITIPEGMYDFSPAISKWEAKTRYIKNYTLAVKQIERGFTLIKRFLQVNGVTEEQLQLKECGLRNISGF